MRRYHVTGIFGDAENGKTTYMVKHMIKELDSGVNYDEGYSNIHIKHKKIKFITYQDLLKLKCPTRDGVARAIVGLDQIHKYTDSRRSNSQTNIDFSHVMIESRQHGFDSIYTTWSRGSVDRRLRPFTNLFVLAQRGPTGFLYDLVDRETGPLTARPFLMKWEIAKAVWQRFDSTELIEDDTIKPLKAR